MGAPASLLPELEDVVQHGSAEKRAETLRRITGLFLDGAVSFNDEHVALFDDVIGYLIEEIEAKALAELARRLAPLPNAPAGVVNKLARNDDIEVAGPVLKVQGIRSSDDVGEIVWNLVESGLMLKSERDRKEDFLGLVDYVHAFKNLDLTLPESPQEVASEEW